MRDLQLAVLGWLQQEGLQPQMTALQDEDFDSDLRPVWQALKAGTVVSDTTALIEALAAYRLTNAKSRVAAAADLLDESVKKQLLLTQEEMTKALVQRKPREVLAALQIELARLTSRLNAARHSLVNLKTYLPTYAAMVSQAVDEYHNAPDGVLPEGGFMTGYAQYDRLTGGLQRKNVVMAGGASGSGKTTLTVTMLYHALWRGYTVAYYCLEMPWEQILPKFIQARSNIQMRRLRLGNLNTSEQEVFYAATEELQKTQGNILLSTYEGGNIFDNRDDTTITMRRIRDELANEPIKPDLWVSDYINLMVKNKRDERAELATLIGEAKGICTELDTIAWLPAQFNREIQGRKKWDAYPRLADFAGSSDPTNTADHVLAIFNPVEAGIPNATKGEQYLCVLKNRFEEITKPRHYYILRRDRDTNLLINS